MDQHKKKSVYAWILFLVWPFGMAGMALKNYRTTYAKNIIWAFIIFYGLTFHIGLGNQGADIVTYIEDYQQLYHQSLSLPDIISIYKNNGQIDILKTIIEVTLSRVTDHPAALTVVYSIIFGYFFSRNMWFILDRVQGRLKWYSRLLITTLFLVIPIWNVNGFRMYTAAHIFIFGLFQLYLNNNKNGLWILTASILVHFSFMVPVITYIAYRLAGNRTRIYLFFFVATLFVSEFSVQSFNSILEKYTPEIVQERSESYRRMERVELFRAGELSGNLNWYVTWYGRALKWAVSGYLLFIWFFGFDRVRTDKNMVSLFSFILLFYAVANLMSSLPSGGRFISVVNVAAVGFIILYFQNIQIPKIIRRFSYATIPALLLFVVVAVRTGFYSMSLQSVVSNPVVSLFFYG